MNNAGQINNMVQKKQLMNFGGQEIGGGLLVQQPFGLRMALLLSTIQGGVIGADAPIGNSRVSAEPTTPIFCQRADSATFR